MKRLKIFQKPWLSAIVYLAIWTAVTAVLYIVSEAFESLLFYFLAFGLIYPVGTAVNAFYYTRNYGLKLWFIIPAIAIVLVEYIPFAFYSLQPNFLVTSGLGLFFGCAVGKQFCIAVKQDKRVKKQEKYKSIIDD